MKHTLAVLLGAALLAPFATGADALIDRDEVKVTSGGADGRPPAEARFTVRLAEIAEVSKATGTVGGTAVSVSHSPVPEEKLQVYMALDVGPQADGRPYVAEEVAVARELADTLLADEKSRALIQVGIGTIGSKHVNFAYTLPTKDVRQAALDSIAKKHQAPDPTSELYRCAQEALDDFVKQKGEGRKVLFLLSSGHSTDTTAQNSPQALAAKAKKEGVPVFVIAFSRLESGRSRWQGLRDLAKETGGAFIETSPERKPAGKPVTPMGQLENSPVQVLFGMLKASANVVVNLTGAPSGKQKLVVEFELNTRRKVSVEKEIDIPPQIQRKTADTDNGGKKEQSSTSLTSQPWFLPGAIGGSVLLLGLLGFIIYKATRPPEAPTVIGIPFPGTEFVDPPPFERTNPVDDRTSPGEAFPPPTRLVIGWLEEYDKDANLVQRHEITSGNFSLGRGSDNSLRLLDDSVSMAHATIHRRSDRKFEITDLRSANKTRVNGNVVEHCVLKDGDKILLGDVRLKLVLNTSA